MDNKRKIEILKKMKSDLEAGIVDFEISIRYFDRQKFANKDKLKLVAIEEQAKRLKNNLSALKEKLELVEDEMENAK